MREASSPVLYLGCNFIPDRTIAWRFVISVYQLKLCIGSLELLCFARALPHFTLLVLCSPCYGRPNCMHSVDHASGGSWSTQLHCWMCQMSCMTVVEEGRSRTQSCGLCLSHDGRRSPSHHIHSPSPLPRPSSLPSLRPPPRPFHLPLHHLLHLPARPLRQRILQDKVPRPRRLQHQYPFRVLF